MLKYLGVSLAGVAETHDAWNKSEVTSNGLRYSVIRGIEKACPFTPMSLREPAVPQPTVIRQTLRVSIKLGTLNRRMPPIYCRKCYRSPPSIERQSFWFSRAKEADTTAD